MKAVNYFYIITIALLVFSCKATKYVPEGDHLYMGAEINFQSTEKKSDIRRLRNNLEKDIKPRTNKRILGLPLKLGIYNFLGTPKKQKGIKYKLRRKLGEAPVLYSKVNPLFSVEVLQSDLYNRGFFDPKVTHSVIIDEKNKKVKVIYTIHTGRSYRINDYRMTVPDSAINKIIAEFADETLIKKGKQYNLERLKSERARLDKTLKNNGYYHFNADYFSFEVDTVGSDATVNVKLKLKPAVPEKAMLRYKMKEVYVFIDSISSRRNDIDLSDTVHLEDVTLSVGQDLRASAVVRYVYLKKDDYYSRENQQLSVNRLMGMDLFKYVDAHIEETDSAKLYAFLYLSPLKKKSLSAELDLVTKSNNFSGPGVILSFLNRNVFKGAEHLTVNLHGSVETQFNGEFKGLYTYEIGPSVKLAVPHFILPFRVKAFSLFTPQTIFTADYNFTRRVNYFDLTSLRFGFGYSWKESLAKTHELMPLNINLFRIRNVSDYFMSFIETNEGLRRKYEDQLIAGITYSYTYNEQVYPEKKNQFYINFSADISGNTVALLSDAIGEERSANGTQTFLGIAYSQYGKVGIDIRNYLKLTNKTQFAAHMIVGVGVPYGNSEALPFIKSYFSGGASSIRAFPVNSLGPGTYRLPDSLQNAFFFQQGGDIKLEWSAEYRFPIISVIKGALFADIGNTWLYPTDHTIPNAQFKIENVPNELAAGIGFGIRADLSFFIIRLDLATPVRKPWLPEGERWVLDDFYLGKKDWRRDNLMLNIAIGYPF
ncbi:MAG: BamA/TamA family outer membrane protein [Cytophagaceae bacterium]|nr:BamA/TamA family outer membrane protein [Cytophagaceae bacterium]